MTNTQTSGRCTGDLQDELGGSKRDEVRALQATQGAQEKADAQAYFYTKAATPMTPDPQGPVNHSHSV